MISIKNKFLRLAAGFWLLGLALTLLGAYGQRVQWSSTGILLTVGITAQAVGFGFLGFVLIQAVFSKRN